MAVAVPLAVVVGLILLSLALLTFSGLSRGPTAVPVSLQVIAMWLFWIGTLIGFLYSCAPSFSLSCASWDKDFSPYRFQAASADALAVAAFCAVFFTLNSGCESIYDIVGPKRGGFMLAAISVLLFAKMVAGLAHLHSASDDNVRLNVAVMGGSFGTAVLGCVLSAVQWKAQGLANPFLRSSSISAPAAYFYADSLLMHGDAQAQTSDRPAGVAACAPAAR